jgi:hypothetical protein
MRIIKALSFTMLGVAAIMAVSAFLGNKIDEIKEKTNYYAKNTSV